MVDESRFQMNSAMHAAFRRELQRLRAGLDLLDLADGAAVAGFQRRFQFFTDTLHAHHQGEDSFLWPKALNQASGGEKVVLEAMAAEHAALAEVLDAAAAGVAGLGPGSDTAAIEAHLAELAVVLTGHCAHEERDGVPIAARYIDDGDLSALVAHARSQPDADLVMPWVCDGAPAVVADAVWAPVPAIVRLFLRPRATRRYERFTAECGV
jgi:hemerythrin-like domain-containing protein